MYNLEDIGFDAYLGEIAEAKTKVSGKLGKRIRLKSRKASRAAIPTRTTIPTRKVTATPAPVPVNIAVSPDIQRSLAEINKQLKANALKREATSEHNSINRRNRFEKEVIRKLDLLNLCVCVPKGQRRDAVMRMILRAT